MRSKTINLIRYAKLKSLDDKYDREVKRVAAELKAESNLALMAEAKEYATNEAIHYLIQPMPCLRCAYLSPPTSTK